MTKAHDFIQSFFGVFQTSTLRGTRWCIFEDCFNKFGMLTCRFCLRFSLPSPLCTSRLQSRVVNSFFAAALHCLLGISLACSCDFHTACFHDGARSFSHFSRSSSPNFPTDHSLNFPAVQFHDVSRSVLFVFPVVIFRWLKFVLMILSPTIHGSRRLPCAPWGCSIKRLRFPWCSSADAFGVGLHPI